MIDISVCNMRIIGKHSYASGSFDLSFSLPYIKEPDFEISSRADPTVRSDTFHRYSMM